MKAVVTTHLPSLISALMDPAAFPHPVRNIQLVETHISWVILTGDYAYKIKKPVDLGFLDFSTLDRRRHYCQEELRLNRRLAPHIYLDVVPITLSVARPVLNGRGDAVEYAVKMVQFDPDEQFDLLLERGQLRPQYLDAVAERVAAFHAEVAVAGDDTGFGTPAAVCAPVEENFSQIHQCMAPDQRLDAVERWSREACMRLKDAMTRRRSDGYVRECHGDMHLRNIAWHEGEPLLFDCIEFSPGLHWIDVISEIAFLVMDLQHRGQSALAWRFLNRYLEISGDYAGLALMPFYLVYRAMVRAKVEAIRLRQDDVGDSERQEVRREFERYLQLATGYIAQPQPVLVVTRGASASGKSTLTRQLLEKLGAVRIRSDVERKRLFGIPAEGDAGNGINAGIYTAEAGRRTYDRLAVLAGDVLAAGFPVIIDAACLEADEISRFRAMAEFASAGFVVIELNAPAELLRKRIAEREHGVSDADLSVLEYQLSNWQPLPAALQACTLSLDTSGVTDIDALAAQIPVFARRGLPEQGMPL